MSDKATCGDVPRWRRGATLGATAAGLRSVRDEEVRHRLRPRRRPVHPCPLQPVLDRMAARPPSTATPPEVSQFRQSASDRPTSAGCVGPPRECRKLRSISSDSAATGLRPGVASAGTQALAGASAPAAPSARGGPRRGGRRRSSAGRRSAPPAAPAAPPRSSGRTPSRPAWPP